MKSVFIRGYKTARGPQAFSVMRPA